MGKRSYLAAAMTSAIAVAVGATPAIAQQTSTTSPAQPAPVPGSAQDSTAASNGDQLQDIVVTAQRRSENAQRISLAMSVIGGEELGRAGIVEAKSINNLVPGIVIAEKGANTQIYLRGVGDNSSTALNAPAIAVSVDGSYIDRPTAIGPNFYDLERIEVLKGPQGTLYGRNSTGGAVNLITAKPSQELGGYVEGEIGNFGLKRVTAAANLPVGRDFAIRIAGQVVDRDGYLSDGYADKKTQAIRGQALWTPSAGTSLRLSLDYAHVGGKGDNPVLVEKSAPGLDPWTGSADPAAVAILSAATRALVGPVVGGAATLPSTDGFMNGRYFNASAELNADLGFAKLTVLPAYRYHDIQYRSYAPGYLFTDDERSRQKTIEVRLANKTGALDWTIGGYYFDIDQDFVNFVSINRIAVQNYVNVPRLDTTAYAFFGQASFALTDRLRAIGGLRYTHEKKDIGGALYNTGGGATAPGAIPNPLPAPQVFDNASTYRATNYRVGFEYDLAERAMLYATVASGFKGGGFYPASKPNTYRPEKITAYTLGLKSRLLDNALQLNLEAFYWDYVDLQQSHNGIVNGVTRFITENVGSARLYGLDIDLVYRVTRNDTLRVSGEYLNSRYNNFVYYVPANSQVAGVTTGCAIGAAQVIGGANQQPIDCSGFEIARAPKWSGTVGYAHDFDLGGSGKVTLNLDGNYASARWLAIDFIAEERAKSYFVGNASLTYAAPNSAWSITGYVSNIFNEVVYTGAVQYPLARHIVYGNINPPRTYGVRARLNF